MTLDRRWRYDALAQSYDGRPDYDESLLADVLADLVPKGSRALEVGAGTGKLTVHLRRHGLEVLAVEPSPAMRRVAALKPGLEGIAWLAADGEKLPVTSGSMDLVAYGSSFNCLDPATAIHEARRVLVPRGKILAVWNHRDLDDPLQAAIERVLSSRIPGYDPGARRNGPMDDASIREACDGLRAVERRRLVEVDARTWVDAWRAHATVVHQAGDRIDAIVEEIRDMVGDRSCLQVPYVTRAWTARIRA